jgi:hypothetical protein
MAVDRVAAAGMVVVDKVADKAVAGKVVEDNLAVEDKEIDNHHNSVPVSEEDKVEMESSAALVEEE